MKGQVHKFKVFDKNIVLDVNSGSVLLVDDLIFDILDFFGQKSSDFIILELKHKYDEHDILDAIKEINNLVDNNILFTDADLDFALEKLYKRDSIKAVCLNVAHDCNLRCKYCFASKGDYQGKREIMSPAVGKEAINFLIEQSGNKKNLEVDFFGGEPTLAIKTIREVISYAKSLEERYNKKFNFTVTTNALNIDDDTALYFNENMKNIVLSLDGRKEINDFIRVRANGLGSYDRVVKNIKKIVNLRKQDKKEYYVRGTFTKYNLDFAEDVFHMADLGFNEISVEPVVGKEGDFLLKNEDVQKVYEQYDKIAREYIKRKKTNMNPFRFYHFNIDIYNGPCIYKRLSACGAGVEYVAVTPKGEIFPCHQFVGQNEFKMGDVFDKKLRFDLVSKFKDTHVFAKEECRTCWARFFCSGGCNANNYIINNDMNKPYDLTCKLQKKRIEYAIYLNLLNSLEASSID